jgi:uncharacterized protein with GYD domain
MATSFVVLCTLTQTGRSDAPGAESSLTDWRRLFEEAEGIVNTHLMTFGRYDAVIAGECSSVHELAHWVADIDDAGCFSTETLIGAAPGTFAPEHHLAP